jgi:hypothetical protein
MGTDKIIKSLMEGPKEIFFKVSLESFGALDRIREQPF